MRVFLDTNVIVAATATRGLCADVLREVLARHDLVICQVLLDEVTTVLETKMEIPSETVSGLLALLRDAGDIGRPSPTLRIPLADGPDKVLLAAAAGGNAVLFVTGDADLLGLRTVGPMAVVSPRTFWELVKAETGSQGPAGL